MREIFQNIHKKQGTLTRVVLRSRSVKGGGVGGAGGVGLRCDLAMGDMVNHVQKL